MSHGEPTWGAGRGTFAELATADSERVLRLLLPAPVSASAGHGSRGEVVPRSATWREVAEAFHRDPTDVDGGTDWHALTEGPGSGEPLPVTSFDHPAGALPPPTLAALVHAVESLAGPESRFVAAPPPGWSTTTAPLTDVAAPLAVSRRAGGDVLVAPLADLAGTWLHHGFRGRVWAVDRSVAIAAPPYADSLVLSGARPLADALLRSGLEVFPVARSAPCPITSA